MQLGLLVSPSSRTRPRRNSLHVPRWLVPLSKLAFWTSQCPSHLPTRLGYHTSPFKVEHLSFIPRRFHNLFQALRRTLRYLFEVLSVLEKYGISLKLKKCHFFMKGVKYLGHIIKPGVLEFDVAGVKSFQKAKTPAIESYLRSFIGLCNVYRRFVPRCSHVTGTLNGMLQKGVSDKLAFSEEERQDFETLIRLVTSPPVLTLPKAVLSYSSDTEASSYQVGCTLFKTQDDGNKNAYPLLVQIF